MATAPVNPQQLHNFPLSLKWGQTATIASSASGAAGHSSSRSNVPATSSSGLVAAQESETESDPDPAVRPAYRVGSRSARMHRFSFAAPCATTTLLKRASQEDGAEKKVTVLEVKKEVEAGGEEREEGEDDKRKAQAGEEEEGGLNGNSRPWKLRPRKGGFFKEAMQVSNTDQHKESNSNTTNNNTMPFQPKSARLRGLVESNGNGGGEVEKQEKMKLWIALSREEIEEDVFIMTGSRPARRPKKRTKNVQKVLDTIFPGLWLVGATADSFEIPDVPVKK